MDEFREEFYLILTLVHYLEAGRIHLMLYFLPRKLLMPVQNNKSMEGAEYVLVADLPAPYALYQLEP